MKKNKLNICLLISLILSIAYIIYLISYFTKGVGSSDSSESLGSAIAGAIIMPHLVCTLVAAIFNALGLFMKKRGFALTGGILYGVAIALFPLYFMFVIIQLILSFIGYGKLKKDVLKVKLESSEETIE